MDSTMVNHHFSPPFGEIRFGCFFFQPPPFPSKFKSWRCLFLGGERASKISRALLTTRMSMVLSKWIVTLIKVGCKSRK